MTIDTTPPDEVKPPFFRFVYDPQSDRFQITVHDTPSADDTGALFGVSMPTADVLEMLMFWVRHFQGEESFYGSIPAHKAKE